LNCVVPKLSIFGSRRVVTRVEVEDAASGQSLIQELKDSTSLPVKPIKVDRDKTARANAVTPLCEAGRVYLPQSAPWLTQFLDEHSNFPNSRFDDTADTTTQALNFLRGSGPPGIFLYYMEEAEKVEAAKAEK
jgi:predicted phage terminase large subunit-like protein